MTGGHKMDQQTSYSDSAMSTVSNQVQDVYSGYGQLITQYQAVSGAVSIGSTPSVQYGYSQPTATNYSRLVSLTYPNGRVEDYGYNTGIDTTISRISTIADAGGTDAGTVAAYTYLGLSTIVQEAEPQINTELTYINQSGDTHALTDGGDRYTGLDRFGRVDDQWYLNTSTSATVDRLQYGYDRDSNVLYQNNLVNGSFSELYHANSATSGDNNSAYDPLSRLTNFRRGTLTSSGDNGTGLDTITTANLNSTTGVPNQNSWSLDALGNWTSGAGVSNAFNSQNEETTNGSSTLVYDHNGNMTTDQAGNLYTYDAWGHVVRIASPSNSTEETFSYDALGRAVVNNNGSGTEDRYYSGPNIIQEQFSSTDYAQYVYGLAYVNDVILRDRNADGNNSTGNLGITGSGLEEREYAQHDTQFSTISLTDSTGAVMQRFIYDPYGTITVLTPTWTVDGTGGGTNYWLYTFQGMRIVDAPGTSGMLFSETRIYNATLGRWISQDWGRYIDGTDMYQFERSSPASRLDPGGFGEMPWFVNRNAWGEGYKDLGWPYGPFNVSYKPGRGPFGPLMNMDMWYNNGDCHCDSIGFIQVARTTHSGKTVGASGTHYGQYSTGDGWSVDNGNQHHAGYGPGFTTSGPTSASMHDNPGGGDKYEFITCAACMSGQDANVVYGCITWQISRTPGPHPVYWMRGPIQFVGNPPSDFWNAVAAWNDYAAGQGGDYEQFDPPGAPD